MLTSTKATRACFCGCGGQTQSRFVPGHDARFHGQAKRVLRGQEDAETALSALPHDEARDLFLAFADAQAPKEEARKAREKAKADAKAARAAAKAEQPAAV